MYEEIPENKINLLIVEDDDLYRKALKYELEKDSYLHVIAEADNGQTAINLANELKPDVILMDLGLPVINGIDATRIIKKNNPDIKIIELTGHSDEEEAIASLSAGANAYARKEILGEYLVMVIETVYKGAVWIDPLIGNKVLAKLH